MIKGKPNLFLHKGQWHCIGSNGTVVKAATPKSAYGLWKIVTRQHATAVAKVLKVLRSCRPPS